MKHAKLYATLLTLSVFSFLGKAQSGVSLRLGVVVCNVR